MCVGIRKAKINPSLAFTNLELVAVPTSLSGNQKTMKEIGATNKKPPSKPFKEFSMYTNTYRLFQT